MIHFTPTVPGYPDIDHVRAMKGFRASLADSYRILSTYPSEGAAWLHGSAPPAGAPVVSAPRCHRCSPSRVTRPTVPSEPATSTWYQPDPELAAALAVIMPTMLHLV